VFTPRPGAGDPGNPVPPGHSAGQKKIGVQTRAPGLPCPAYDPGAAEIREQVDKHRSFWLRGYYRLLGQAYLTLVPVS
jgi:hypothetical protein